MLPTSRVVIRNQSPLRYRQIHPYWPNYRQLPSDPPLPQPGLIFYPLVERTHPRSLFIMAVQTRVKQPVGGVETPPSPVPRAQDFWNWECPDSPPAQLMYSESKQPILPEMHGRHLYPSPPAHRHRHHRLPHWMQPRWQGLLLLPMGTFSLLMDRTNPLLLFIATPRQDWHPIPTLPYSPHLRPLHKLFTAVHITATL